MEEVTGSIPVRSTKSFNNSVKSRALLSAGTMACALKASSSKQAEESLLEVFA